MQMFRFLRRVFIILILFVIIFFIFRLVKPEATSRFVDKVRAIPTGISNRFHREKKSKIIINGDTTSASSNFDIVNTDDNENDSSIDAPVLYNNEEYDITDSQTNTENKDTSRLDEFNREIDKILASGNNQAEWEQNDSENNWDLWEFISELINDNEIEIIELTWTIQDTQDTEFVVIDVEQPYEPEPINQTNTQSNTQTNTTPANTQSNSQGNTQSNTQSNTTTTKTNTVSPKPQRWDCGEWLTVQDCEDLIRDFENLNFN